MMIRDSGLLFWATLYTMTVSRRKPCICVNILSR